MEKLIILLHGVRKKQLKINMIKKILFLILFVLFFNQLEAKENIMILKLKNGDVEIYYIDYGPEEGTPVLLVQGLGGQLTFWPNQLIEMFKENGFRPIVYDNRDVGLSHSFEEYGKPNFVWN